jgi:hypothetical protein
MILIGIKLFLRSDELCSLTVEQFLADFAIVAGDYEFLEGIAVVIHGKSDKVPVTLMLWADPVFPLYCPIRHLLFWLKLSGIKSGFLFPSYEFMIDRMSKNDWNFHVPAAGDGEEKMDMCISYQTFQHRTSNTIKTLLGRSGPWGTHSIRKSALQYGVKEILKRLRKVRDMNR